MNSKRSQIAKSILVVTLIALVALAASCGPAAAPTPEVTTGATPTTAAAPTEEPTPTAVTTEEEDKDTLVVALQGTVDMLDVQLESGGDPGFEVRGELQAALIMFKVEEVDGQLVANTTEFEGNLAESWSFSEDGATVTFHLRPDLKFPNGDPVDADALKYTFDRAFAVQGTTGYLFQLAGVLDRDHIKVIDDRTVEMTMDPPNGLLFPTLAVHCFGILNPSELEPGVTDEDAWATEYARTNDCGAGPFTLESWTTDEMVFVRNDNFWDPPRLKRIIFKFVPDAATRLFLLQSGAVDYAAKLPLEVLPDLESDPEVTVIRAPSTSIVMAAMDNKTAPFDSKLVRQAISYAIPYETIIEEAYQGYAQRLHHVIPEGMPGYDPTLPYYDYDPDEAQALLEQAGYPDGFDTELFIASGSAEREALAVWIQSGLRDIGINVEVTQLPYAEFRERQLNRDLPFAVVEWQTTTNDPIYHMSWLYRHDCCDYANYENEEVWDLIDQYFLSADVDARTQATRQCQELILEDAPYLFIAQLEKIVATRSNVKGVVLWPNDPWQRFETWYKE